ncbi:MAG: response regulator [Xenococcaceae cyanobacterium]
MTAENTPYTIPIGEFIASKQASLFQTLKQPRFSGQLVLRDPKGRESIFYLYLGRIMYATGGTHPVRRWKRNLAVHLPQIASDLATLQPDLAATAAGDFNICWEYDLLCLWVKQQKITREQVTRMISAVIAEVLFDLTQTGEVTYYVKPDKYLSTKIFLIDADQVIVEAWKLWQAWQAAKVADRSPNTAPVIRKPEQLRLRSSDQTYQALSKLLDGQHSLRDLAVQMKRDMVQVTRLLMPYIQLGLVELVEIPDLPAPVAPPKQEMPTPAESSKLLIACVDRDPLICQTMEKILTAAGYQFLGVNDALEAIALFLAHLPDLIFIDMMMPNPNGYEICDQLRKLPIFRDTPIIILTENEGIIDRVRAKMVGCSDFMKKPVDAETLLGAIANHLKQDILT